MKIDLSRWAKVVKILLSHVSDHQKVTSSEEKFINQVDRMACSMDRQRLLLVIPVTAKWPHEQSGHSGQYGGYTWGQ